MILIVANHVQEKAAAQAGKDEAKRKREKQEQTPCKKFVLTPGTEIVELD